MKYLPAGLIITFLLLLLSCSDESECVEDTVARVVAGFYARDSISERDTTLSSLTFYRENRPDSLIYSDASAKNQIEFPLPNITDEYTSFVLQVGALSDIIEVYHTSALYMVSYACGFTTMHEIYWMSYSDNIIDTIAIADSFVDLNDFENLKIYIKPSPADTTQQ